MRSVFGSVNGRPFDRDSVLTKSHNQYSNVSLYVNNQFDETIHQLSVRRLDTETVNQQRVWQDQMDETVVVTERMGGQNVVSTPVAFHEKLVVENLNLEGDTLFGARMQQVQLNMGVRRLLDEQARGFKDLLRVVERATAVNGEYVGLCLCMCMCPGHHFNWASVGGNEPWIRHG